MDSWRDHHLALRSEDVRVDLAEPCGKHSFSLSTIASSASQPFSPPLLLSFAFPSYTRHYPSMIRTGFPHIIGVEPIVRSVEELHMWNYVRREDSMLTRTRSGAHQRDVSHEYEMAYRRTCWVGYMAGSNIDTVHTSDRTLSQLQIPIQWDT